jgi:hypothetical protein
MISELIVQKLSVEIRVVKVQNNIVLSCPDNHTLSKQSDGTIMLSIYPSEPRTMITISGKTQEDTLVVDNKIVADATVKFNNVWINNILIEPWAFISFCNFCCQRDKHAMDFEIGPDLMFYTNGTCNIDLNDFFYRYHKNLIAPLLKFNDLVINSHLGNIDPLDRSELQIIYEQICDLKK